MTDPTPFGTALHERVRDEHPDLDRLVRSSTAAGTRLRRRRQAGLALAAAAGVAVVAVGVAALQGPGRTTSDGLPIATQPTSAPVTEPDTAQDRSTPSGRESELEKLSADASRQAQLLGAPVRVTAEGWECDQPADEKYTCSKVGAFVVVNWRDAASHDDYLDPGKADVLDGVHTFVSDVHGQLFATVAPAQGTTQAEVDEVGASLLWVAG
ncbi:hypothetical protein [Nocardioides pyridinolyticus]